ncbi:MAG: hypothetical protein HY927_07125 [Elusimicrobia bacterium]|nr:hypothetical protein [Elusimicrobiota bacterium]
MNRRRGSFVLAAVWASAASAWADSWPPRVAGAYSGAKLRASAGEAKASPSGDAFRFYYHPDQCHGAFPSPPLRFRNAGTSPQLYREPSGSDKFKSNAGGWKELVARPEHSVQKYFNLGYPTLHYFIPADRLECDGSGKTDMAAANYQVTGPAQITKGQCEALKPGLPTAKSPLPFGLCGEFRPTPMPGVDRNKPAREGQSDDPLDWCLMRYWTITTDMECVGPAPEIDRKPPVRKVGACSCEGHGSENILCYNDHEAINAFYLVRCEEGAFKRPVLRLGETSCNIKPACCEAPDYYGPDPSDPSGGTLGERCRDHVLETIKSKKRPL